MKSILTVLFALALGSSLFAGDSAGTPAQKDQPGACCAPEPAAKPAACCADKKADKPACCTGPAKPAACCATAEAPRPAACCPVDKPVARKPAACCAEIENRESLSHGAGRATDPGRTAARNGTIEKLSSNSLYQLDATFTADNGQPFALASLRGRPVVLTMFFASCGYACPMLLTDMHAIRAKLPAEIRDRAALVLVSFDVERDTPAALRKYRDERHLDAQWVLLHGDDASVRELAALLGVKYVREADGMFAHSNLITVLNAGGEVVHQRTGLRGGLDETAQAIAALR